jgi:tetratricopeptide (TPR) repeat protein
MSTPHEKWMKAQEHLAARELEKAMTLLNEALYAEPENANFISERAVVYFHLGDRNMALLELDRAVLLEPDNPYRYSSRAYVKAEMKMIKGAILDYEICVQLDPDDAIAYNNLGLLLEAAGKLEAAKHHYKRADELEGILNERGISLPEAQADVDHREGSLVLQNKLTVKESIPPSKPSFWKTVGSVVTNKNLFKEYILFVKAGCKMKEK